jgi:acyl-CoA hydrolase
MESYKLVLPEHLNHYGYLFGGNMLKWVDEVAWIAASREHPGCEFVTVAMDRVEFRKAVHNGAVLRFDCRKAGQGTTSVRYRVDVYADDLDSGEEERVFVTTVSFVCLDRAGVKQTLG